MHNRARQSLILLWICFSAISCSKTVRVYHPPHFDLTRYECLGIIAFSDNADPSVSSYATQQFQNQIHSAQAGIPILHLGTENEVLRSVNADRLDFKALQKIGRKYNVVAVFQGSVMYSDIETDLRLKSIRNLKADVDAIVIDTAHGHSLNVINMLKEAKKKCKGIDIIVGNIGTGEAAVSQLALKENINTVCIDEGVGRRVARLNGLKVTGSLGILIRAKKEGHSVTISDAIERMISRDIHLSDRLICAALKQAGEEYAPAARL